jgi:nucleoside-diphosphate-sugar epimerase
MLVPQSDLEHVLQHTEDLWKDLRGKRIFITGGTGFFGTWLIETVKHANQKLGLGAEAVVLTRQKKAPSGAVSYWQGDVRSFDFPTGEFSHVIHAATAASQKLIEEDPLLMADTVLEGTRRALDFARSCGAKRFLLTSSGAVYGRQPPALTHIDEDFTGAPDPVNAKSVYGESKRMAENLCILSGRKHGFETVIARAFAFVGPHLPLDAHYAIGNFMRDGLQNSPIRVAGDGTPRRSYLYAADLAIWLWTLLLRGKAGRAYNVGSDQEVSIAALAGQVAHFCGSTVEIAQRSSESKLPERYVPSIERAKAELGLRPWISLDEAIARTIDWHRARH